MTRHPDRGDEADEPEVKGPKSDLTNSRTRTARSAEDDADPDESASLPRAARPSPTPAPPIQAALLEPPPLQKRDPERYQILAEHGRGGLGRVYRARDRELGRDVAVKELLQPTHRAEVRFLREALITARLEHPGIVPVHEAGRWPDGTPYYAMKLVAGRPLSALMAKATTPDQRLAFLTNLIAVADAIAYAHDRNIIHRDIKPSNIIVGEFGETIVIDWGLAKDLRAAGEDEAAQGPYRAGPDEDLTVAGTVVGTPAYMSPEQSRGDRADPRSDVYSLGVILFELCTGAAPKVDAPREPLRAALKPIQADLATIILKCLAAAPDDRYPNAGALAADLKAYDTGAHIAARTYSAAAILGHWIRHHKTLTVAIAIPSAVALLVAGLSFRKIIDQRDRLADSQRESEQARTVAESERGLAERERDRAVSSEASMLLEKDPTRARDLLATRQTLHPDDALLMARATGAGTADFIVSLLPYKILRAVPDPDLQTLAIVATDNRLRTIDLSTGVVTVVDEHLLEPPLVIRDQSGLTYARRGRSSSELVRSHDRQRPIPIPGFRLSKYNHAVVNSEGTYLLDATDRLLLLEHTGHLRLIRQGIREIASYQQGLLACTSSDLLYIGKRDIRKIGRCRHDGGLYRLATHRGGYVVQVSSSTALIEHDGNRRVIPTPSPSRFVLTKSGLVAGIDGRAGTWYAVNSGQPTHVLSSSTKPLTLAADGDLAAWGFADGDVHVQDTRSKAAWTLTGHAAPVTWLYISERLKRVVSVGGPEVRVWRIPPVALEPIGSPSCGPFNIAPSPDGALVAFDCYDGTVSVFERDGTPPRFRALHKHAGVAFGVAWRGKEVCSSSWDGQILCTNVATNQTTTVASHVQPVRFVHGAGDWLAYIVEDGGVWSHRLGDATPQLLYRHEAEPYRVAVTADGDVASGAQDGSVMSFDRFKRKIFTARDAHKDRVFEIAWRNGRIYTSSWDGTVRLWNKHLVLEQMSSSSRPLRELRFLDFGWATSEGATAVWVQNRGSNLKINTGPLIRDLSTSPDGRYVAAVVDEDVIIYDAHRSALAAVRILNGPSNCAQFVDPRNIFVCGPTTEIFSIAISSLPFTNITRTQKGYEPNAQR